MLDLDSDLDRAGVTRQVVTPTTTAADIEPVITERVTVIPASTQTGYKGKPTGEWNWSDLRDYLIRQIEDRHGPQVRDPGKEAGICKGFISRWGIDRAVAIARYTFEVSDGMWRNSPVTITRFCKNSDRYFADIIAARIA